MPFASGSIDTPDGVFTVIATADAVVASGWTDDIPALAALADIEAADVLPEAGEEGRDAQPALNAALDAVSAFYRGVHDAPARIPTSQRVSAFRARALDALRETEPGSPVTYTELAENAGNPRAVRAAASACAANAVALFVPCHRAVRSDGTSGKFRYGEAIKRSLLEREAGTAVDSSTAAR